MSTIQHRSHIPDICHFRAPLLKFDWHTWCFWKCRPPRRSLFEIVSQTNFKKSLWPRLGWAGLGRSDRSKTRFTLFCPFFAFSPFELHNVQECWRFLLLYFDTQDIDHTPWTLLIPQKKKTRKKAVTTLVSFVLDKLSSTSQTHLKRPTNIPKLCDG